MQREKQPVTKAAVARQAGVSLVFLRSHLDLMQAVEEAAKAQSPFVATTASGSSGFSASSAADQVIAALRRRLEDMKRQLAAKDQQLCRRQQEIALLYGKLAAASPLTDAELRDALASALERLTQTQQERVGDHLQNM